MEPFLSEGRFVRQTGGMGMFALVVIAWHPSPELEVEFPVSPDSLPLEYRAGLEEGLRAELGGRPGRAVVVDALHHVVDSSPRSFKMAGRILARDYKDEIGSLATIREENTAERLMTDWKERQSGLLTEISERLSESLPDFLYQNDAWIRAVEDSEQLIRLSTNTPNVPSLVDLRVSLSYPRLLEFLGEPDWRERPQNLPQELGTKPLRGLSELGWSRLKKDCTDELLSSLLEVGRPYLDNYTSLAQAAVHSGYVDKGTRAALHLLTGEKEAALALALDGQKSSLGNPRQKRFCERVLEALK